MTTWHSIEELTSMGVSGAGGFDAAAFNTSAGSWRAALTTAGVHRVAVHTADAIEFGSMLLGAWGAGCTVWLPGDATTGITQALQDNVDVFLGDFQGAGIWHTPPLATASAHRPFPALPLVVFTSGSSGAPLACEKSKHDLNNEALGLEAAFGANLQEALVAGTVDHQHIYGLLFRVLWPLCANRPIWPTILRYPEEIESLAAKVGRLALVSSPAFLKRLPPEPLKSGPEIVFSAGGMLPFEAAMDCTRVLGCAPMEVYGSTEGGGAAWRQRKSEDQVWSVFKGVDFRIESDGQLLLRTDRVNEAAEWVSTGDRAEAVDGGFRLLGRMDRIAKVEEKRVSLTAMESLLEKHGAVREARMVLLKGHRDELGAVLTLKDRSIPSGKDKTVLVAVLKKHLRQGFEAVVLPRRWRLVESLPVNLSGKTTQALLASLFEAPRVPELLSEQALAEGKCCLHLRLPENLFWFQGHFPEAPVLPGVVQVDWAIREGCRNFGHLGDFMGIRQLKFNRPLQPGDVVTLTLDSAPGKAELRFSYDSAKGRHSSGHLLFRTAHVV